MRHIGEDSQIHPVLSCWHGYGGVVDKYVHGEGIFEAKSFISATQAILFKVQATQAFREFSGRYAAMRRHLLLWCA